MKEIRQAENNEEQNQRLWGESERQRRLRQIKQPLERPVDPVSVAEDDQVSQCSREAMEQ